MKKIQILGSGCPKCKALAQNAETAAKELGLEYTLDKVTNIKEVMKFGVMTTPALVIDGEVKTAGKLLNIQEIKEMLKP
ncbi:MAG: thioredoxin family protein [Sedimentisphaerales bacterium]|jgi:small redox-active disulfide protein 2